MDAEKKEENEEIEKIEFGGKSWVIVILLAAVAFFWWQREHHQDYLRRTDPAQRDMDRERIDRQDREDAHRSP